jgi:hypothetical protein
VRLFQVEEHTKELAAKLAEGRDRPRPLAIQVEDGASQLPTAPAVALPPGSEVRLSASAPLLLLLLSPCSQGPLIACGCELQYVMLWHAVLKVRGPHSCCSWLNAVSIDAGACSLQAWSPKTVAAAVNYFKVKRALCIVRCHSPACVGAAMHDGPTPATHPLAPLHPCGHVFQRHATS